MFDKDEFLKVYGDLHLFIGMLLHKAHGDDKEMFEAHSQAAATMMARIIWLVDSSISNQEVVKTFDSRRDIMNRWSDLRNIPDELGEA